jgi:20S proteasome subunit alpha 7
MTCKEAVKEVARIIYKLHDDIKDKEMELELSWACDESGRKHVRVPEDLRQEAVKLALEAKEKAEMDDSDSDSDAEEKQ